MTEKGHPHINPRKATMSNNTQQNCVRNTATVTQTEGQTNINRSMMVIMEKLLALQGENGMNSDVRNEDTETLAVPPASATANRAAAGASTRKRPLSAFDILIKYEREKLLSNSPETDKLVTLESLEVDPVRKAKKRRHLRSTDTNSQNKASTTLDLESKMQEGEIHQFRKFAGSQTAPVVPAPPEQQSGNGEHSAKLKALLKRASQENRHCGGRRDEDITVSHIQPFKLDTTRELVRARGIANTNGQMGPSLLQDSFLQTANTVLKRESTGIGTSLEASKSESNTNSLQRKDTARRESLEAALEENSLLLAETRRELNRNRLLQIEIEQLQQLYAGQQYVPTEGIPADLCQSSMNSIGHSLQTAATPTAVAQRDLIPDYCLSSSSKDKARHNLTI